MPATVTKMLSPGDEFEWTVDGATLTLVMPAGAKHGQEHEFSFVADDGGTRFFKATIPSNKAPLQATGEKRYAFHQERASPAAATASVTAAESIVLTGPLTGPAVYVGHIRYTVLATSRVLGAPLASE